MIKSGEVKSESDLARKLGTSRARINQIISLLKLDRPVIKGIEKLGDPLKKQVITERRLRPYLSLTREEQQKIISFIGKIIF